MYVRTYLVLDDANKKLIGPFYSEQEAREWTFKKKLWPPPRIIGGVTTYGLTLANWKKTLGDDWVRECPD